MDTRVSFAETDKILSKPKAAPFLRSLEECEDNELRITVAGAKIGDCAVDTFDSTALGRILSQCRPIESDENLAFEITFESYIIYQVRNESFCSYDPQEIRHGKFLIISSEVSVGIKASAFVRVINFASVVIFHFLSFL